MRDTDILAARQAEARRLSPSQRELIAVMEPYTWETTDVLHVRLQLARLRDARPAWPKWPGRTLRALQLRGYVVRGEAVLTTDGAAQVPDFPPFMGWVYRLTSAGENLQPVLQRSGDIIYG